MAGVTGARSARVPIKPVGQPVDKSSFAALREVAPVEAQRDFGQMQGSLAASRSDAGLSYRISIPLPQLAR